MAGHSKWANIKHRKERTDKKKSKIFSRLAKEIITAVKLEGEEIKNNNRLRLAIAKAKSANMPQENIHRNIKRGLDKESSHYMEMMYEIYGYEGVGILVEAMTDNKNRMASEIRIVINKCGGSIASPGEVSFNFDQKGCIYIENEKNIVEDELFLAVTDAGAEDFRKNEELYQIITQYEEMSRIREALEKLGIPVRESILEMLPKTTISCDREAEKKNLKLIEWLENIEDVDAIFHNMSE